MFRALLFFVLCLMSGCGNGTSSPSSEPGPTPAPVTQGEVVSVDVYSSNVTLVTSQEVSQWIVDINTQFTRDIAPRWGFSANLSPVSNWDQSHITLIIEDHVTGLSPAGAQGYHDAGTAWVDVYQSLSQNGTPEATAGKELIEVVSGRALTGPVAPYAYPADGVNATGPQVLHDFLLPAWFSGGSAPFDLCNVTTAAGQIAPGGLGD